MGVLLALMVGAGIIVFMVMSGDNSGPSKIDEDEIDARQAEHRAKMKERV